MPPGRHSTVSVVQAGRLENRRHGSSHETALDHAVQLRVEGEATAQAKLAA